MSRRRDCGAHFHRCIVSQSQRLAASVRLTGSVFLGVVLSSSAEGWLVALGRFGFGVLPRTSVSCPARFLGVGGLVLVHVEKIVNGMCALKQTMENNVAHPLCLKYGVSTPGNLRQLGVGAASKYRCEIIRGVGGFVWCRGVTARETAHILQKLGV